MKIQSPTVGPIVGYTTADQVRIWLRGEFQKTPDGYRRCFGVAQLTASGAGGFGPPQFVKLPPYFDMTGVCAFTHLQPETTYEYRAGWFFAETGLDSLDATQDLDWSNAVKGQFRTGTADKSKGRSYVVGSCRYLLKLFGGLIFDERGDKTFNSILTQIRNRPVDGLVMVGDQIYADDLNFIAPGMGVDQFLERYRATFSQPNLRQLMSQVPTYMVLDDHEIEDNWPSKADDKDQVILYPAAMHSYQVYQCSHSPLFKDLDENNRVTGTLSHFWYLFRDGCCDWFVTDCRTERVWSNDPSQRRMVSEEQMEALLEWLADGSGLVKLIVSSVPFFPDLTSDKEDKWTGFVPERTRILDFILAKKIRKVVFVSGDVHCSLSAELKTPQDPSFKVISVISSSFFWPYPHMDSGAFGLTGKILSSSANQYEVVNPSPVYSTDNFGRMDITPAGLSVSFFERKGAPLGNAIQRNF